MLGLSRTGGLRFRCDIWQYGRLVLIMLKQRSQRQLRNEITRKEEDLRNCRSELSVGQPAEIDIFEQQLEVTSFDSAITIPPIFFVKIQERERERFLSDIAEIAQKEIDVQAQRNIVQEGIAGVDQRVFELRNATKHLSVCHWNHFNAPGVRLTLSHRTKYRSLFLRGSKPDQGLNIGKRKLLLQKERWAS